MAIQRADFAERVREFRRAIDSTRWVLVVVIVFALFLPAFATVWLPGVYAGGEEGREAVAVRVAVWAVMIGVCFGPIFLLDRYTRRTERRHGLICPNCEAALSRCASYTLTTGRCSRCERVIVEGEPPPPAGHESRRFQRTDFGGMRRVYRTTVILGAAVFVLFALAVLKSGSDASREYAQGGGAERGAWQCFRITAVLCAMAFAAIFVVGRLLRWGFRRVIRRRDLLCPNCGSERLFSESDADLAIATGRCGRCGALVVEGESAPPAAKAD